VTCRGEENSIAAAGILSGRNFQMNGSSQNITQWFLLVGKVEGYSYLILLGIAMPLKYIFKMPEFVRPVGMTHGILFIAFMILLALMFCKLKLSFKNSAVAFLLSLVPFGTFFLKKLI
jgi:integral membrane protein